MNVSDTLNLAADLIEERGWGRGIDSWAACDGPICIDEALARALGFTGCNAFPSEGGIWPTDLANQPVSIAVRDHLGGRLPGRADLYDWNDDQESAEAVIEVLRATAVIEAAREARERQAVSA